MADQPLCRYPQNGIAWVLGNRSTRRPDINRMIGGHVFDTTDFPQLGDVRRVRRTGHYSYLVQNLIYLESRGREITSDVVNPAITGNCDYKGFTLLLLLHGGLLFSASMPAASQDLVDAAIFSMLPVPIDQVLAGVEADL